MIILKESKRKNGGFHPWFAWRPVRLIVGDVAWLQYVGRRWVSSNHAAPDYVPGYWEYSV